MPISLNPNKPTLLNKAIKGFSNWFTADPLKDAITKANQATQVKSSAQQTNLSATSPQSTQTITQTTTPKDVYIKNTTPTYTPQKITPTIDNSEKIKSVQQQIADLQAQADALNKNNLTDTSEISKNATGGYEQNATGGYNKALAGYTDAYKKYIETLNPTAEQTATTEAYNKFKAGENTALQNISEQTIPMRFITGQQKSLESRAEIEANRLQNEIATAKEQATAKQNVGLANVSLKEKLLGMEQSPAQQAKALSDAEKATADIAKTKAETENIAKKFEEDKRQFGLEYALKQQNLALEQQKSNVSTGTATPESAMNQINLVKSSLEKAKSLADASGRSGLRKTAEGLLWGSTDYTNLVAETNTLRTNVLTMMTDPSIKKFFGPQMSNADVQLMTSAGTTLNPELQSPEKMKTELERLDDLIKRMESAVKQGVGASGANSGTIIEYEGKKYKVESNGELTPQ